MTISSVPAVQNCNKLKSLSEFTCQWLQKPFDFLIEWYNGINQNPASILPTLKST